MPPNSDRRRTDRIAASPRARRALRQLGLDPHAIRGTGPGGRIVAADLHPAAPHTTPAAPSAMRRAVAARTAESVATIPHFYLRAEVDATAVVDLRRQLLEQVERDCGTKLSLTDLLLRALACALRDSPEANRIWSDGSLVAPDAHNVGLVVGLDDGLIIPVIARADQLGLAALARRRAELAAAARAGRVPSDACALAATSLSNLGDSRVDEFTAIIPSGQSSVLAVGRVAERPWVVDRQLTVRPTVRLTLSADHRVLDGQPAARFLSRIVELLESPALLLYDAAAP